MQESSLLSNYLNKPSKRKSSIFLTKILLCIIILLSSLIFTSLSDNNLILFKEYVFDKTLPFIDFQNFYHQFTGEIKKDSLEKEAKQVFATSLEYTSINNYLDGQVLAIDKDIPIKSLASGIVVYAGEKEGYNKTIIIQGSDGYDIWYGNLENINISIYDYVNENATLASASDELYIVITKDNKYYTYEEYQSGV